MPSPVTGLLRSILVVSIPSVGAVALILVLGALVGGR